MANFRYMGIKRKVFLGCVVLALILLISSSISMFEYTRMNDHVTELISDNTNSIEVSRELLAKAEEYNLCIMHLVVGEVSGESIEVINDEEFISFFSGIRESFVTENDKANADSVIFAFTAYMHVVREASDIWLISNDDIRKEWYFNRLQPVYVKLKAYIEKLTNDSQDALIHNSQSLQDNFYRSLMPGLISVLLGFIMVLLFNYFLNHYLINPLLKISHGIKGYLSFNKNYDVKIESQDELAELNECVKDIIDINKSTKKQSG